MRKVLIVAVLLVSAPTMGEVISIPLPEPGVYHLEVDGNVATWYGDYYGIAVAKLDEGTVEQVTPPFDESDYTDSHPTVRDDLVVFQRSDSVLQDSWLVGYWVCSEQFYVVRNTAGGSDIEPDFVGSVLEYTYAWHGDDWGFERRSMGVPAGVAEQGQLWNVWVDGGALKAEQIRTPEPSMMALLVWGTVGLLAFFGLRRRV